MVCVTFRLCQSVLRGCVACCSPSERVSVTTTGCVSCFRMCVSMSVCGCHARDECSSLFRYSLPDFSRSGEMQTCPHSKLRDVEFLSLMASHKDHKATAQNAKRVLGGGVYSNEGNISKVVSDIGMGQAEERARGIGNSLSFTKLKYSRLRA